MSPSAWLRFARAGRAFVVGPAVLRAVVPQPEVARVPSTPAVLVGLIAWRGGVVPLLEPAEDAPRAWRGARAAVLVASEGGDFAVAADSVEGFTDGEGDAAVIDPGALWRAARRVLRPDDDVGGTHAER